MTLGAAYGRIYKSAREIREDWDAGRDFEIRDLFSGGGRYVNKADAPSGIHSVRYAFDRKVTTVRK